MPLIRISVNYVLWLMLFTSSVAVAHGASNVVTEDSRYPIDVKFQVVEDVEKRYSFNALAQIPNKAWKSTSASQASFGFNAHPHWLRTTIVNQTNEVKNFILEIDYTLLDYVAFQVIKQGSNGQNNTLITGDMQPFYPRAIDHPSNALPFQLGANEQLLIYINVQTQGSLLIPLELWQAQEFFEHAAKEQRFHYFYYGALSFIVLINFAVFITLKEKLYLYYATAIFAYLGFFSTSRGHLQQIFTGDFPELSSRLFLISMPLLALFSVLFAREFLRSPKVSRKLDFVLKGMITFEVINLLLAIFAPYNLVVKVSSVGAILLFSVLFIAGPITWIKGKRTGVYYTIAWTPLAIGFFVASGRTSGLLPNNFVTEYAMQIGSGIEAVILALALAERLFREREHKIKAQEESIAVEKQHNLAQKQLTEAMSRYPVSQLSNRNRFEWLIRNTINANPNQGYIVSIAKISRLDDITKTLGLSSTERIVRLIAKRLNEQHAQLDGVISSAVENGQKDCVYQLSHDVFGSLICQSAFEQDPQQYYDVLKCIAQPIEIEKLAIDLAPLFGSALYPKHGKQPAQLIRNAHIALSDSRNAESMMGVFHEQLDIYDEDRLTLATQLREALQQNELVLYYQPKINVNDGNIIGLEALTRWVHQNRGFIPPDQFIQVAEESGLINELTMWAIESAIVDTKALRDDGYTGSVSINISARDLLKKSFVDDVSAILERHQMPPQLLCLELTETAAMEDPKMSIATLTKLTSLGIKISVDDFGTGYSSLSYLQRLPANEVKLDRSLTKEICQSDSTLAIVKASIDMAHALNYSIVAEGVEDEQTKDLLHEYHCDSYQGFWRCKPLPIEQFTEWLANQQDNAEVSEK